MISKLYISAYVFNCGQLQEVVSQSYTCSNGATPGQQADWLPNRSVLFFFSNLLDLFFWSLMLF